jgi:hypothetical protein
MPYFVHCALIFDISLLLLKVPSLLPLVLLTTVVLGRILMWNTGGMILIGKTHSTRRKEPMTVLIVHRKSRMDRPGIESGV